MLLDKTSNTKHSNSEYKRKNRKLIRISTILIVILTLIAWIYNSYKLQEDTNQLYAEGIESNGIINKIERDNLNTGNITSWEILYSYSVDSKKYSGELNINEKPEKTIGDSISIFYLRNHPEVHSAHLYNIEIEYIGLGKALLEEWYYVAIGLIFILLLNIKWKGKD